MSVNNNAINAQDLMQNESVSWLGAFQFIYPYEWMKRLTSTATGMCGHGFSSAIMKVLIWVTIIVMIGIPVCIFYRPACFYIASWIRLLTGVGGKSGFGLNIFFVSFYTFWLIAAWIPFLIPAFIGPISGEGIMQFLNIV